MASARSLKVWLRAAAKIRPGLGHKCSPCPSMRSTRIDSQVRATSRLPGAASGAAGLAGVRKFPAHPADRHACPVRGLADEHESRVHGVPPEVVGLPPG